MWSEKIKQHPEEIPKNYSELVSSNLELNNKDVKKRSSESHGTLIGVFPVSKDQKELGISYETLLDDATRFEKKAKEAGVEVKLDIFPEMQHVWHFMAGAAPEADQAIKQMADWVKPKIGL